MLKIQPATDLLPVGATSTKHTGGKNFDVLLEEATGTKGPQTEQTQSIDKAGEEANVEQKSPAQILDPRPSQDKALSGNGKKTLPSASVSAVLLALQPVEIALPIQPAESPANLTAAPSPDPAKLLTTGAVPNSALDAAPIALPASKVEKSKGQSSSIIIKTASNVRPDAPSRTPTAKLPQEQEPAGAEIARTAPELPATPKPTLEHKQESSQPEALAIMETGVPPQPMKGPGTHVVTLVQKGSGEVTVQVSADTGADLSDAKNKKDKAPEPVITVQSTKVQTAVVKPVEHLPDPANQKRDLVFRQVSDHIELMAVTRPKEKVTVELNPPDLGKITIVLLGKGKNLSVELGASNPEVREMFHKDAGHLTNQLALRGLNLQSVTVTEASKTAQSGHGKNQANNFSTPQQGAEQHQARQWQQEPKRANGLKDSDDSLPQRQYGYRQTTALDLNV